MLIADTVLLDKESWRVCRVPSSYMFVEIAFLLSYVLAVWQGAACLTRSTCKISNGVGLASTLGVDDWSTIDESGGFDIRHVVDELHANSFRSCMCSIGVKDWTDE